MLGRAAKACQRCACAHAGTGMAWPAGRRGCWVCVGMMAFSAQIQIIRVLPVAPIVVWWCGWEGRWERGEGVVCKR